MTVIPRLLGRHLPSGLLAVACLVFCGQVLGQSTPPANPLRSAKPIRPTKKVAEPVAKSIAEPVAEIRQTIPETTAVEPASLAEPALAKPVPAEAEPEPIPEPIPESRPMASVLHRKRPSPIRRTSFGFFPPVRQPMGYSLPYRPPIETHVVGEPRIQPPDGEIIYEGDGDIVYEGGPMEVPGELGLAGPATDCCSGVGCMQCCMIPCPTISFENLEFFFGAQGLTGPMNRGETGSFGFHQGFNWGFPVPCTTGALGAQIGLRTTQNNLSGAEFSNSTRRQLFLTGGLFRRVDWGLQGGLVADYLSQDWYSNTDLVQVRGEASWVFPCTHELGFWFTTGSNTDTKMSNFSGATPSLVETWQPTHLYAFFYRQRFDFIDGADARFSAGFSGDGDGLIGSDINIFCGGNWALKTGFTYLIPTEGTGTSGRGHSQESWNVALSVVWYPGCGPPVGPNYFRPLLDVADNGSFMVDRK